MKPIFDKPFLIKLKHTSDQRGKFARFFCKQEFSKLGYNKEVVQINHTITIKKGSLRGLHYQAPPFTEAKYIRCMMGKVFDVLVDIRSNSPDFLKLYHFELTPNNNECLIVPEGFAHGFQTLANNVCMLYFHTNYYKPESERGILYNDPDLKINWPMPITYISDKDLKHPSIKNFNGINLLS